MKVLVCGGAGYLGSHTCVSLIENGHEPVVYDNYCNSSPIALERVARIVSREIRALEGDIRDEPRLLSVLQAERFDAVIHFAALKSVGESSIDPLPYFENNISGTISLLRAMRQANVGVLVFSSSATVYGNAQSVPVRENAPLSATNPYGRTKLVAEQLIGDISATSSAFNAAVLRYFNPIGAHPSGLIGEDPCGVPNNLMPYITQVAAGRLAELSVFGNDYPTPDGTGVRDYIHVMDLAEAHVAALEKVANAREDITVNLGTGQAYSVLELVRAFSEVSGKQIPMKFAPRRPGDVAELWADPSLARQVLGWQARLGIRSMCEDAWRWQSLNPHGYR